MHAAVGKSQILLFSQILLPTDNTFESTTWLDEAGKEFNWTTRHVEKEVGRVCSGDHSTREHPTARSVPQEKRKLK